jgi:Arylsulfotransferase (ASST)
LWDHAAPEERRIERIPLDGSAGVETIAPDATHDFWEDGDGTFTYLAYDLRQDVHIVGDLPAVANRLRTVPEGATDPAEVVDGFAFFDDYPAEPWFTCSHAAFGAFVDGANEWTHVSSLVRAPDGDGWWIVVRHFDAIVAVGDDGAFRWQAGGRDGTLTALAGAPGAAPVAQFEHGHASHAWGDRILVFDNGDHSPRPIVSRVVELRIDPDAGTWEEVWSLPAPSGTFESFLGDARRLPGGNTLVAWTDIGEIAEYTPEGDEVWRVDTTEHYGRAIWVPALTP